MGCASSVLCANRRKHPQGRISYIGAGVQVDARAPGADVDGVQTLAGKLELYGRQPWPFLLQLSAHTALAGDELGTPLTLYVRHLFVALFRNLMP